MKRFAMILSAALAALILFGCSSGQQVLGKWKLYQSPVEAEAAANDEGTALGDGMNAALQAAVIEFRGDGTVYLLAGGEEIPMNTFAVDGKNVLIYDGDQVVDRLVLDGDKLLDEDGEAAMVRE